MSFFNDLLAIVSAYIRPRWDTPVVCPILIDILVIDVLSFCCCIRDPVSCEVAMLWGIALRKRFMS